MMDALRSRETPDGEKVNARPKYLVIPSGKEATSRILASSELAMGEDDDRLQVVVSPWLSGSHYYLVADPVQAPSVVLATLEGSNGEVVSMLNSSRPRRQTVEGGRRMEFDGMAIDVNVSYGLAAVERNIVRNTVA